MKYILALDQGTTSSRSIVFDQSGKVVSAAQKEFGQIFPESGFVEHDPIEIWETQSETAIKAVTGAGLTSRDINAIGITNQRETTVIWDRKSGKPVYNAIVWQDRRTSKFCDLVRTDHGDLIRRKTGLEVDAYFSASKINWILNHLDGTRERAEKGELCFGTVDSWLMWNLTGGNCHLTDVSNASRTMIFDIRKLEWDTKLLAIFEIPKSILPEVRPSSEIYAEVVDPVELAGIKIAGIAGDQQAALFGHHCFTPGSIKNTYGTGSFMLQNTGGTAVDSQHNLLTTIAWQIGDKVEYALEGSVFIGGAVVQWLRDSLKIIEQSEEIQELANSVPDNGGVYFVPAFAGLGSPYWDPDARGMIIGLTRGTGRAHIARAAIESIAFQTADLLDSMKEDSGIELTELRVDGGAAKNDLLLQFQADLLQFPVVRSKMLEATALGTAYLAGLATGYWKREDLASDQKPAKRFMPAMHAEDVDQIRKTWDRAVKRALRWAK